MDTAPFPSLEGSELLIPSPAYSTFDWGQGEAYRFTLSPSPARKPSISRLWFWGLILTFLGGLTTIIISWFPGYGLSPAPEKWKISLGSSPLPSLSTPYALSNTQRIDFIEQAIFDLTNQERRKNRLPPLQWSQEIREVAAAHSKDMLQRRFFDHTNPDGLTAHDRVTRSYPALGARGSGENIIMETGAVYSTMTQAELQTLAAKLVDRWMRSSGHRENILRVGFQAVGIGVALEDREVYATQVFLY